jgi:predicted cytidylate kinase
MVTITVSGTPGSGKSTIAQLLHEKLGIKYVNSGMIFRETAKKYKMSLEEFGKYCEKNSKVDKELDNHQVETLKKGNVILEGRLAGWLAFKNDIPSFKIMIDADVNTRAKRVVNREKGDADKRKKEIVKREKSEAKRYKNYYGIDLSDITIYDLVIDSSDKKPEEIIEFVLEKLGQ